MSAAKLNYVSIDVLVGKTITSITGAAKESDEIDLYTSDGQHYRFWHGQECCENVQVEDVIGDLNDLIGSPLLMSKEHTNSNEADDIINKIESYTWTFYHFATIRGYVTLRWLGTSNGYYSEAVGLYEVVD